MPLYEYHCLDCEAKFDLLRSASAADQEAKCTICGGKHTERLLSRFVARSNGSNVGGGGGGCSSCGGGHCSHCGSH